MSPKDARTFWQNLDHQSRNRPSDDLQRMLDLVWSHRVSHKNKTISGANADVYALYNRIFKNWSYTPGGMMGFLQGLTAIQIPVEVQCRIAAIPGKDKEDELGRTLRRYFGATRAASGFAQMSPGNFRVLVQFLQTDQNGHLMSLLAPTFFHYRRTQAKSEWRIYLHVNSEYRPAVMRWVLANIWRRAGCSNAKVGGPAPESRADNIVIYLRDQASTDVALQAIRSYQTREDDRKQFEHGVPRTVREVPGLVGVGTGAEPPVGIERAGGKLLLRNIAASFGSYRQALIDLALEVTLKKNEGKDVFIRRVVAYFRMAGIDPAHPDRHVNIENLIAVAEYIEWCIVNKQPIPDRLTVRG